MEDALFSYVSFVSFIVKLSSIFISLSSPSTMEYTSTGHEMQPLNPHPTQNCKKDFLPECTHTYQPPSHLTKETGIVEVSKSLTTL